MLFHETILKKHTNGKTNFQDGKEYNQEQSKIMCFIYNVS